MIIQGTKVALRPVSQADLDQLYLLASAIEVNGEFYPITFKPEPLFRQEFRETGFWTEKKGTLVVIDKGDRLVGSISYFQSSTYHACLEVGFVTFRPADRGKGFMTEAIHLFVPYLFAIKPVPRLEAVVLEGNSASERVLEKSGFRYEGTKRDALFYRGNYVNLRLYSILRAEAGPLILG